MTYSITTTDGVTRRWHFQAAHSGCYSTSIRYITIINPDAHTLIACEDVRLRRHFNFEAFCEDYIKNYFNVNLKEYHKEG